MTKRSPSALSKEYMAGQGYIVETVERWIPGANIRKDLFGFGDLLCLRADKGRSRPVIVQTTSLANVAARIKKIHESELLPIVLEHFTVSVHGWAKKDGRYQVKVVQIL